MVGVGRVATMPPMTRIFPPGRAGVLRVRGHDRNDTPRKDTAMTLIELLILLLIVLVIVSIARGVR